MSNLVARAKIGALQETMFKEFSDEEREEAMRACVVKHYFAPGLYMREIFLPKGTVIVGKLHMHAHGNTISMGHVAVATEFEKYECMAPYTFVSEPGTKRVVHALEDTFWTTYHPNPTNTQDLAELEKSIIAESYAALGVE